MRRQEESDVPDFLHNSPFLPLVNESVDSYPKQAPQPKPTVRQLLKSKPTRAATAFIFGLCILLFLRSRFRDAQLLSRLTGPSCYFSEPQVPDQSYLYQDVDWSQYAYVLYATNTAYLCSAVMLLEMLYRLGAHADRVLMYPNTYSLDTQNTAETRLLMKARDEFGAKLIPVEVQHENTASYYGPNWADSYTKLLAFNQTQYNRILVLDSDSSIQQAMDELFFLPSGPAAMPHAYWLDKPLLSSHIMVLTPSTSSFSRVSASIKKARYGIYDMEIMNSLFGSSCITIPHRTYALLTGEYRSDNHKKFLDEGEEWNPDMVINDAKFVHFSDHPLGKPWEVTEADIKKAAPACNKISGWEEECRTRDVWLDLYNDYRERRKRVCEFL